MFCTCATAIMRLIATSTPRAPKKPMENGEWFSSLVSFCTTTGGTGSTGSSGVGVRSCFAPLRALPNRLLKNFLKPPDSTVPLKGPDFFPCLESVVGMMDVDSGTGCSDCGVGEDGSPTPISGTGPVSSGIGRLSSAPGAGDVTSPACVPVAAGPSPRHR